MAFLYLTIGVVIGTMSGALGIGGGVLLVPALMWICKLDPRTAAGTSLAVFVIPVFLPAAWKFSSARFVHLPAALWIAAAFSVGGFLGAYLRVHGLLREDWLRVAFGLVLFYVAARFLLPSDSEEAAAAVGLIATGVAWLAYLGLRLLGRRHVPRPSLSERIRQASRPEGTDPDYYI